MKNLSYVFLLFLLSCSNNEVSKETLKKANPVNQNEKITFENAIPDSLNDYNSYYYLSNMSTRDFAALYLKDSIITGDYKKLYDCLDSLTSNNLDTRNYYFEVLVKSLNNLEVVYHQNMGVSLVKYIDNFRNEFLERILKMNDVEIRFFAQGVDSYLSQRPDKGKKWINDLKVLKVKSTFEQTKRLSYLLKEIENTNNDKMD